MRRYISILIVAISIAATSCNNFLVKEESTPLEGAFVTLAVGKTGSRTILPESYDEVSALKDFVFTATSEDHEPITQTFTDYDSLQTAKIPIVAGTWDFSLSATSKHGVQYKGALDNKIIVVGSNNLSFDIQIAELSAEPGSLEVQLTFPGTNVAVVKAGLYSIAGEALDGFPEEVLEITGGSTVTYNKDTVPGGSHLVQFSFYGDDEGTVFLGMHTEVIVIVSGKKSAATRSIEAINQMYTITYELDGGSFVEGYTPPRKFTPNMELQLPKVSEVQKPGEGFLGWYTDAAFTGSPVYSIPRGTGENKTYYAKWGIFTAETIDEIDLGSVAGDCNLVISGPITSETISTLTSKLTATGTSAKIHLDLSQTTGLTSIGDYAFKGCSGLTSVEIPASVTSIGSRAFYECSGLTSVEIPAGVTSIGSNAFYGCSGLTSVYYQGDLARWCEGFEGGYSYIYSYMQMYCENLYINGELVQGDLVIPDGVTSIDDYAFYGCSGLTSVEIPASVTSIGSRAFYECRGLTRVTFGAGSKLESIGDSAFRDCSGLPSVVIPSSVTSIGERAFSGCSGLTSVYYQGDLDRWCAGFGDGNHYLMSYCENLYIKGEIVQGDLVIPAGVTSIGEGAFSGCSGLTSVEIPAGVTSIGYSAFHGCSGLTSVEIPAGVTSIDDYAFYGCSGLTSVEIPAGVTSIGNNAFWGCSGLTSVTFGEGSQLESIGSSAFRECSGLTSVEIPASVTSIGIYAFYGCSKLTSVTFWDTSGWYVTTYNSPTGGSAVPLSPTNLAANARLVNDTYAWYYWYKK